MFFCSDTVEPEEEVFWSESDDLQDYTEFVAPYRGRKDLFIDDGRQHGPFFWMWRLRQRYLGNLRVCIAEEREALPVHGKGRFKTVDSGRLLGHSCLVTTDTPPVASAQGAKPSADGFCFFRCRRPNHPPEILWGETILRIEIGLSALINYPGIPIRFRVPVWDGLVAPVPFQGRRIACVVHTDDITISGLVIHWSRSIRRSSVHP